MDDKRLCPAFKLIHKPDGGCVLSELVLCYLHCLRTRKIFSYRAVNHKSISWSTQGSSLAAVEKLCDVRNTAKGYFNIQPFIPNFMTNVKHFVWVKRLNYFH